MDRLALSKVIILTSLSVIVITLGFLAVEIYFSVQCEKRIKGFTLEGKNDANYSIADVFISFFRRVIKFFSKGLSKSSVFKKYAKRLSKYYIYNTDETLENIDYISFKFLIMLFIQGLYIITVLIRLTKFNIFALLLVSIISFFVLDIAIIIIYNNKKKQIEEQLLQAIIIMNSAFKSGKNIMQAIDIVREELPSPIKDEFEIVSKDISYGLSLYETFTRFSNRVKLEEAKYITSSLALLSKTGGNIVTVFNMIEQNFYDRLRIKNELNALTATSKFLYHFLTVIPFVFISVIVLLNPSYFDALINTKIGILIDIIMVIIYLLYFIIIKKLMKVDKV